MHLIFSSLHICVLCSLCSFQINFLSLSALLVISPADIERVTDWQATSLPQTNLAALVNLQKLLWRHWRWDSAAPSRSPCRSSRSLPPWIMRMTASSLLERGSVLRYLFYIEHGCQLPVQKRWVSSHSGTPANAMSHGKGMLEQAACRPAGDIDSAAFRRWSNDMFLVPCHKKSVEWSAWEKRHKDRERKFY